MQNKNNILPLQKGKEKIAVIGPNADNAPMMWGNYNGMPNHTITILNGIKAKQKKPVYIPGCDLTNDRVMESRLATECTSPDGKKGLKGTFWTNTKMEGKSFTTEYYTKPVNVADGKGVSMGTISMAPDAIMLKGVTATAHVAKVQSKGDTLIYNATGSKF